MKGGGGIRLLRGRVGHLAIIIHLKRKLSGGGERESLGSRKDCRIWGGKDPPGSFQGRSTEHKISLPQKDFEGGVYKTSLSRGEKNTRRVLTGATRKKKKA